MGILRYITFGRLRNIFRCYSSYLAARFGHVSYRHMPLFIAIEPANRCMLRCPECPVGIEGGSIASGKVMPPELYTVLIDEVAPYAHTAIFHFQGEPLLSPHLPHMVAYAHSKRMFTMLSTNAQLLTPERADALAQAGLDRIIISVDGLTPATYEHYRRGGSLERALNGMKYMSSLPRNRRPEIVLQCLMLRSNEHEWDTFRRTYRQLGADRLEFKTAQFYDFEHGNPDMPSDNRFCRYMQMPDGRWRIKRALRNRCFRLWSGCVVTADGEVRPCCYAKSSELSFGTLDATSYDGKYGAHLSDILHSPAASHFREKVFSSRSSVPVCLNCDE